MKSRKVTVFALSALLVVGVIGGTYAYWNQIATIDNPFNTGTYGTSVVEDFTPEEGEDWEPGATIAKEVYVTNEGDYDLIVRVKLDESWTYAEGEAAYKENAAKEEDINLGDVLEGGVTGTTGDVYTVEQDSATDGLTDLDHSVVVKTFAESENWVAGGDGWYYYTVNLEPGEETDVWLESVTLLETLDMGSYETTTYLSTDNEGNWILYTYDASKGVPMYAGYAATDTSQETLLLYYSTEEATTAGTLDLEEDLVTNNKSVVALDPDIRGYSDSDYVLTITVETVQAMAAAVEADFGIELDVVSYDNAWVYSE